MRIFGHYSLLGFTLFLLLQIGCKENPIQTVEVRDDEGRLERYQWHKQDSVREGRYQKFSAAEILLEEATYHQDLLEGEKKYFYPNGNVESIETYKNGQLNGKYRKFFEDGKISIEQDFANGAMQGFSIRYYPNGTIQERVTMVENEEQGPFQEYYDNGVLKTEGTYAPSETESALEQGELKEYDETGQLVRIADCKDGRCTTRLKQ